MYVTSNTYTNSKSLYFTDRVHDNLPRVFTTHVRNNYTIIEMDNFNIIEINFPFLRPGDTVT